MSDNFDWNTDEEESLASETPLGFRKIPGTRRLKVFNIVGVTLGLLFVAAIFYWQLNNQLKGATDRVEEEIRATHRLIEQAGEYRDTELLKTLLSGRDPTWQEAQEVLVAQGWIQNPPMFGWTEKNEPPADEYETTITLSPNLKSAELQSIHQFTLNREGTLSETVTLQQTAIYRQGKERWLLSPPDTEFWGNWLTSEGTSVTLIYPARDETIARRLLEDLNTLVGQACQRLDTLLCPADLHVRVYMGKNLKSLVKTADPRFNLQSTLHLVAPAPTLIGQPMDEASYQALYRGYGRQVITAVITHLVGYRCCQGRLLYQEMVDRQLGQLDISLPPITHSPYDDLMDQGFSGQVADLLSSELEDSELTRLQAKALISFLDGEVFPAALLTEMQRRLSTADSLTDWLDGLYGGYAPGPQFETGFLSFVLQQTQYGRAKEPPIPLPQVKVQLTCEAFEAINIFTGGLQAETWTTTYTHEFTGESYGYLQPLNGRTNSLILTEVFFDRFPERIETTLVENGQESRLPAPGYKGLEENETRYFFNASDPNGRYLLLSPYQSQFPETDHRIVDLNSCNHESCHSWPVTNEILWSPTGKQTLMSSILESVLADNSLVYAGDERGLSLVEVGQGVGAFWLTDGIYGYIRQGDDGEMELVTAVLGEKVANSLLSTVNLSDLIPHEVRPDQLWIAGASTNPSYPRQLIIDARPFSVDDDRHFFFVVELTPGLIETTKTTFIRWTEDDARPVFSPDGRFLTLHEHGNVASNRKLQLIDLVSGQQTTISNNYSGTGPSWSADGQWFVVNRGNHLLISAPAYDYQALQFHPFQNCPQISWLQE